MEVLHDEQLAARQELLQVVCVGHDRPVQHASGGGLHAGFGSLAHKYVVVVP